MPRRVTLSILTALLPLLAATCWPAASNASSAPEFLPCSSSQPAFSCTNVPVPLDRSGAVPGTITLSVARKLAGTRPAPAALIALAGGPGQPALPFAEFNAKSMSVALHSRDLLVFDQRGTGSSDPLSCAALERFSATTLSRLFADCAEQIGRARGAFTTQESVRDIEALRQATGYEKLVLYGTSYGTKVALEYAERFPQHVEALVLDSVVPTDTPEPFAIPTFEAIGEVVRGLCAARMCAAITPEPLADLTQLIAKLRKHPLRGSVYDGLGKRHETELSERGLLGILEAGDLNPALRALLPAAIRSSTRGDPDPLLRLQALSEGLIPNIPAGQLKAGAGEETDEALFVTTTCEEAPFPWQRGAPAATRLAEALAYLHAQPASDFAPFDAQTALQASLVEACDAWPYASAPPPPPASLPNVPTLILSGAQDLRTPTSGARRVAALIPGAQVEVVPFTGHSVIGSDLTGCAAKALAAFFSGQPIAQCTSARDLLAPTPITPRSLARIHPPARLGGRPGRTLVAALDTLLDLNRQVIAATLQADASLPSGASFGGLHGGFARLTSHLAELHNLSFVPGVRLTGSFPVKKGHLLASTIHVGGAQAAAGQIRLGSSSRRVTGTLSGHSFNLSLAKVRLSRSSTAGEWPAAPLVLSRLGRERLAGPLSATLAQLP
jgi:pimeloyl-ACP methyl ester carboxylesterase